jgi:hypothetical protein
LSARTPVRECAGMSHEVDVRSHAQTVTGTSADMTRKEGAAKALIEHAVPDAPHVEDEMVVWRDAQFLTHARCM